MDEVVTLHAQGETPTLGFWQQSFSMASPSWKTPARPVRTDGDPTCQPGDARRGQPGALPWRLRASLPSAKPRRAHSPANRATTRLEVDPLVGVDQESVWPRARTHGPTLVPPESPCTGMDATTKCIHPECPRGTALRTLVTLGELLDRQQAMYLLVINPPKEWAPMATLSAPAMNQTWAG